MFAGKSYKAHTVKAETCKKVDNDHKSSKKVLFANPEAGSMESCINASASK